jgi:hypothetical protein
MTSQFSYLLTTEYSAKVADEDKYGRRIIPQRSKFDRVALLSINVEFTKF